MTKTAASKKLGATETQGYVLMDACFMAYMRGWKGKLNEREAPELIGVPQGTERGLLRRGLVAEKDATRRARGRRYPLTRQGVEIGEALFEKYRGEGHPRDRYLKEEEVRLEREREEKDKRERVATALAGLKLDREVYRNGYKPGKLDLSKEIRSGTFPQLNLDDLDKIIQHLT